MLQYLKFVNMVVSIVKNMLFIQNSFSLQFTEILFVMNYRTLLMHSDQKRKTQKGRMSNIQRTHTKVWKS